MGNDEMVEIYFYGKEVTRMRLKLYQWEDGLWGIILEHSNEIVTNPYLIADKTRIGNKKYFELLEKWFINNPYYLSKNKTSAESLLEELESIMIMNQITNV
jgi:hypothetical protein